MRALALTTLLCCTTYPALARGEGDIAEAVRFAAEFVGDEVVEGFEDFVDSDPDEALSLLLSRDVVPGRSPEHYLDDDSGFGIGPAAPVFDTLGDSRLSYRALEAFIAEASRETGLPAALIDAVIRTESGYRPAAVSKAGAVGLMQLLPSTAREVGVRDVFDPRSNILAGSRYLKKMLTQFGSLRLAVAAYNAGPGAVSKHAGVPPYKETIRYVSTVLSRYQSSKIDAR